jgi:hypothetical protein
MNRSSIALLLLLVALPSFAETTAPSMVYIPVAGTISNASTAYTTTMRLTNRLGLRQLVRTDWIARDGIGSRENTFLVDLAPNETRLILSTFPIAGFPPVLGAVKFIAVEEDGSADATASIEASAVINATRLADLALLTEVVPGVQLEEMRGGSASDEMVFYPVLVPSFLPPNVPRPRANYGIVNDSGTANTFVVQARFVEHAGVPANPREETVTVAAHGMVQRPLLTNGSPIDDTGVIVTIRRLGTPAGVWTAYVSSIDGATGDAMLVPPLPRNGRLLVDD